jgi:RNA polymerase sigma factor (sigma-70 family)
MTHPHNPGSADAPGPPLADLAASAPSSSTTAASVERGGESEFSSFYREHFQRLAAYLLYQGASAHLSADLAQNAMATAFRRWPELTSPKAYVYKVAGRELVRQALDALEQPVGEVPEPTTIVPRPEETEAWLQKQQVISVLRALPQRQRQVLALTIDGWYPAEIAELLGIEPAAVRSSLMKARRSADEHRRRIGEEAP